MITIDKAIAYWSIHKLHGLYYKHMTIVKDESRVVTKLETSLSDDARVIIYDVYNIGQQRTCKCCEYRSWTLHIL
jgi:hypothetical protein